MNPNSALIIAVVSLVPYVTLALGYAAFTDGTLRAFGAAIGALFVARLFFAAIEAIGSILAWRWHGKKQAVTALLKVFQMSHFPKRYYEHDNFLNYLARIDNDEHLGEEVKAVARSLEHTLELHESSGILGGVRMHSATEAALELYSRRSEAPALRQSDA